MLSARDVADYFVAQTDLDSGEGISNLKVQKLVYYAQGYHLAIYGTPLFEEDIEAWQHGPVVPSLYREFKESGADHIPLPVGMDFSKFTPEVVELLNDVYSGYGQFSAWRLRQMTHAEAPWLNAYKETERHCLISKHSIQVYFRTLIQD